MGDVGHRLAYRHIRQFSREFAAAGLKYFLHASTGYRGPFLQLGRLVKKLRVKKIDGLEEANRYLEEQYGAEHNARFAVMAASARDFHLPNPGKRRADLPAGKTNQLFPALTHAPLGVNYLVRPESGAVSESSHGGKSSRFLSRKNDAAAASHGGLR